MLDRLSVKISEWICGNANIDGERKEVIAYGVMAIIHIVVFATVIAIVGLLSGTFLPIMTICWSAAFFRQQSGGAHAKSPLLCTVIGCTVCFLFSVCCKALLAVVTKPVCCVFAALVFAWSICTIEMLVPVDSPNKPIKTEEKKRRMKRNSRIVLALYAVVVFAAFIFGSEHSQWVLFALSICVGIGWQNFMLTSAGHVFAREIQKPLSALIDRLFHR